MKIIILILTIYNGFIYSQCNQNLNIINQNQSAYVVGDTISIEHQLNEYDREEYLITQIAEILQYDILDKYKAKKITSYSDVNNCKGYMNVIMNIHNLLNYHQYMITMNVMKDIFTSFNRMIYNYII